MLSILLEDLAFMRVEQLIIMLIKKGTQINYESINEAINQFRTSSEIHVNWKNDIDKDYQKRNTK